VLLRRAEALSQPGGSRSPLVVVTAGPVSAPLLQHLRHLDARWPGVLNVVVDVSAPTGNNSLTQLSAERFLVWPAHESQLREEFACDVHPHPFHGVLAAISVMHKLARLGFDHIWMAEDDVYMPGSAPEELWLSQRDSAADLIVGGIWRHRKRGWHWGAPERCFLPECNSSRALWSAYLMLTRVSARLIRAVHATHKRPRGCAYIEASLPTLAHRNNWPVQTFSNGSAPIESLQISLVPGVVPGVVADSSPIGGAQCIAPGIRPSSGAFSDESEVIAWKLTRPHCPENSVYHPAKMSEWQWEPWLEKE